MERRQSHRFIVGLECSLYFKNKDKTIEEFCGKIEDVSETGVKVGISEKDVPEIKNIIEIGDEILFQSADDHDIADESRIDVLIGEAKVVRIEEKDNNILLACTINNAYQEFYDYIDYKKVEEK